MSRWQHGLEEILVVPTGQIQQMVEMMMMMLLLFLLLLCFIVVFPYDFKRLISLVCCACCLLDSTCQVVCQRTCASTWLHASPKDPWTMSCRRRFETTCTCARCPWQRDRADPVRATESTTLSSPSTSFVCSRRTDHYSKEASTTVTIWTFSTTFNH